MEFAPFPSVRALHGMADFNKLLDLRSGTERAGR